MTVLLSRVSARQKKAITWANFLNDLKDESLKSRLSEALLSYQNILARCWEEGQVSEEDELRLLTLERELTKMNEEVRMTVHI
jgi:hypothetical protein